MKERNASLWSVAEVSSLLTGLFNWGVDNRPRAHSTVPFVLVDDSYPIGSNWQLRALQGRTSNWGYSRSVFVCS
jgi:hypothetical protein